MRKIERMRTFKCEGCGIPVTVRDLYIYSKQRFCGQSCALSGSRNGRFKGGSLNHNGYRVIRPTPRKPKFEHIVIAEKVLGKPLPAGAEIHHVNEIKSDNRNQNLVICENHAYHMLIHARTRVVRAGGDPDSQSICGRCHLVIDGFRKLCSKCNASKCREYWRKNKEKLNTARREMNELTKGERRVYTKRVNK